MDNYCRTKTTFRSGCCDKPCTYLTKHVGGVDDRKNPPVNGEGFNTIVVYDKTGNVYIYDSYGIPTKIGGDVVLDDYLSLDSINGVQNNVITGAINELQAADDSMNNAINGLNKLMDSQYKELVDRIKNVDVTVNARAFDPTTGKDSPLQQIVDNLYVWAQDDAIMASEFDALDETAETFEEYDMTAKQFDLQSKTIMGVEETTEIAFEEETDELELNANKVYTLTVTPDKGATPIGFASSNPDVAIITKVDGRSITVKAMGKGETTITATAGELTAEMTLTVVAPAIASMSFPSDSVEMPIGTTIPYALTVTPLGAEGEVTYASTAPGVANVTGEGFVATVEALTAGTAVITATSGEIAATMTVTVNGVDEE